MNKDDTLNEVTVTYPAACKPFEEKDAARSETIATLKAAVLKAFGLSEGTSPDGTTTTYRLYHGKQPLEDLNQTLGTVAGNADALHLKLAQQITQG
jgi:hypothetical protein